MPLVVRVGILPGLVVRVHVERSVVAAGGVSRGVVPLIEDAVVAGGVLEIVVDEVAVEVVVLEQDAPAGIQHAGEGQGPRAGYGDAPARGARGDDAVVRQDPRVR